RLRQRLNVVLEPGQLGRDVGRDQVGPGREDLPELGERRPELLERFAQSRGPVGAVRAAVLEAVLRDHCGDPGGASGEMAAGALRHPRLHSPRFFGSPAVFTMTTVQRALCETRFGTLPSRNSRRPLMPMLPTTRTSARSASAAATIASEGSSPTPTR